jgi:2-amino-4-hydroxy-6-hydroxymethyldihydropteridine diphosphokinase
MSIAAPISNSPLRLVVGIGSNLGNRLENLQRAASAIGEVVSILARSDVYETPPAGGPPQPDYFNAAVLVQSPMSPAELLERCLAIERSMGRTRPDAVRWGPRPIDIDLLWAGELALSTSHLSLPHPRLRERPFALRPLLDLVPDARDPHDGTRYAELPAATASIRRVGPLAIPPST